MQKTTLDLFGSCDFLVSRSKHRTSCAILCLWICQMGIRAFRSGRQSEPHGEGSQTGMRKEKNYVENHPGIFKKTAFYLCIMQ